MKFLMLHHLYRSVTHLRFELVLPVRTCVPMPLDRPTQVLRGSSRTIHLTHSEPTHTVRVCCLVLGPHSSQRVHHTRTHTHRVDTNIDNLGRSPLQRTFLILTGHPATQVMQLLSRRHRVHPPPSVLEPAQPPPTRSHSVGVITTPDHIHTADQDR